MFTQYRSRWSIACLIATLAAGCSESITPSLYVATVASGGTQSLIVGTASEEMTLVVTSTEGEPVADVVVTWATTVGTLAATTTTTNAQGQASNSLTTVGAVTGQFEVSASAGGARAVFSISVAPVPPDVAAVASGGTQSRIAGTESEEMTLVVMNAAGEPRADAVVTWATTVGTLAATTTTTNAQGQSTNTLTSVGGVTGQFEVVATSGGSRAVFSVTVTPVPPGRIEKFSSDPGNLATGASDSVRVRVLNYLDVPTPGVTVTFTVTAGGGTVSPATAVTDEQGVASTRWTRGGAGANTVTASAPGHNNSPVAFNVTAVPQVTSIQYGATTIVVDSGAAAISAAPVVRDGAGMALTGAVITYVSRTPAVATVDLTGRIVGVTPGQSIVVASVISATNQVLRDSLLAVVAIPGGPVMLTDLPRFDLRTDTIFTVAVRADMRASAGKLGSARVTVTWDPAVLTFQDHAAAGTNVGATVNATNAPDGTIIIAFASADGFGGNVELRRLTFRAASTAQSGALSVLANEAYAAGTYHDLLPFTVSVATPLFTR